MHCLKYLLLFSHSVVLNSLRLHGLQHVHFSFLHHLPGVCSNSCPLSWWCHPTISSSVVSFSSCFQSFPTWGSLFNESALHIRWPKYWSFSISLSNECSGLISFRIDWFDLLAVQGTPTVFSSTIVQKHQLLLTFVHDYWKHQTFYYMDLCWHNDVSA